MPVAADVDYEALARRTEHYSGADLKSLARDGAYAPVRRLLAAKTPQQIALKWILAKGATYTCQTTSKKHFQEDIDVFDFELSAKDLAFLDGENLVL